MSLSGGCQCGHVRYRIAGALEGAHLCHCRMCQKAAGNYFMPLASARETEFSVTRGEPGWFQSSGPVRRGFCSRCGTPLFFKTVGSETIAVTLGSLDDPSAIEPESNDGVESRVAFFAALADKPGRLSARPDLKDGLEAIRLTNHQHPDHDTDRWPEGTIE